MALADPMGTIIAELKAANLASGRVRGGEPAAGDAKAAGAFQRFVVLVDLGGTRFKRAPLQQLRYGFRCYGSTYQDARALYAELSGALHIAGPRIGATGVGIYLSADDTGGSANQDPDTEQPYYDGVIDLFATAEAVAA